MEEFFKKYPLKLNEKVAVKMMDSQMDDVYDLCKEKDEDYLKELAKLYAMIEDFFDEKGIDPATLM